MQKLMLTLLLSMFICLGGIAANNKTINKNCLIENPKESNNLWNTDSDCTSTASWTATGVDCFGNPVTMTATCTVTASTCSAAYTQAGGCAYSKATLGLSEFNDCP